MDVVLEQERCKGKVDSEKRDVWRVFSPAAIAACCASLHSHSHQPENNQLQMIYFPSNIQTHFPTMSLKHALSPTWYSECANSARPETVIEIVWWFAAISSLILLSTSPSPVHLSGKLLPAARWRPQLANSWDAQLVGSPCPCLLANPARTASLNTHHQSGNYAAHVRMWSIFSALLYFAFL